MSCYDNDPYIVQETVLNDIEYIEIIENDHSTSNSSPVYIDLSSTYCQNRKGRGNTEAGTTTIKVVPAIVIIIIIAIIIQVILEINLT